MPASPGESTVHYLLEEFQHSFSGFYLCGLLLGVFLLTSSALLAGTIEITIQICVTGYVWT